MKMTEQQTAELLDRIRDERGEPPPLFTLRFAELLAADDDEATALEVFDLAETELKAAEDALATAQHDADVALRAWSESRYTVKRMRHELGLVATATGYKTARQVQADSVAAAVARTLRGDYPQPAATECAVCGSDDHNSRLHADPVTGLIGGLTGE